MIYKRNARYEDIFELKLRDEDIRELQTLGIADPLIGLADSILNADEAFSVLTKNEDKVIGMGGVSKQGAIWFLASPDIAKYKMTFLKQTKLLTEELSKRHPILYNIVDSRNDLHIKWLKWLDFEFTEKIKVNNVDFWRIQKCA